MADNGDWVHYLYPWPQFERSLGAVFMLIGVFLLSLGLTLTFLPSMLVQGSTVGAAVISLLMGLGFGWGGFSAANTFPNIRVAKEGLAIHFLFRWWFIPWTNLVSVAPSPLTGRRGTPIRIARVVRIRELTFFHRYLSLSLTWKRGSSVFLINSNIRRFDELMCTIRRNMGEFDGLCSVA